MNNWTSTLCLLSFPSLAECVWSFSPRLSPAVCLMSFCLSTHTYSEATYTQCATMWLQPHWELQDTFALPHCLCKCGPGRCTSRIKEGDLSCPSVLIILHTLHLSSSSAGPGKTHLQPVLHSLLWHGRGDVRNLQLLSGNLEVDLHWWQHTLITGESLMVTAKNT